MWRDDALIWGDALHLDDDIGATIADPACFAGATACATLILALPANPSTLLDEARALQQRSAVTGMQAGATIVGGLLIARWLGQDALALRRAYADLACHLRQATMGLPPRLPRLWHI